MKTIILDIRNNAFPTANIPEKVFVVWRNLDPVVHSAETLRNASFYFNAGALLPGEVSSPVYFDHPGSFPYLCRYHAGMQGIVTVAPKGTDPSGATNTNDPHDHHHHLQHLHGFVTGGRTGNRFFMTHTPVLADHRHHYQVILQGSLTQQEHIDAYDKVRNSVYGDRRVQIFHEHLALVDIRDGVVTTLPNSSFEYYPVRDDTGESIPGLEENIPVRIDRVLHFHQFEPDTDYPEGLEYLVYGDMDDVFIDHHITRAPNFHSVAKLAQRPDFWKPQHTTGTLKILIPSKRMFDVSPKILRRVTFVDNSFHIFWLPPSGVHATPPQDPLIRRDNNSKPVYESVLEGGTKATVEVGRFLHFDVRLLNHGVLIV